MNNTIQKPKTNAEWSEAPLPLTSNFEINLSKETFKFNAAHFVAFPGFRERLHGHNYRSSVRLLGTKTICNDGYLLDFGDMKGVVRDVCKEMNEYFICPIYSDVIQISVIAGGSTTGMAAGTLKQQDTVKLVCEDGATFLFPKGDCLMLPLVHATAEELSIYIWGKILTLLDVVYLRRRGIHTMEVTVAEAPGQDALFRMEIPQVNCSNGTNGTDGTNGSVTEEDVQMEIAKRSDVRRYISSGDIVPRPCLPTDTDGENVLQKAPNTEQRKQQQQQDASRNRKCVDTTEQTKCCSNCETALTKQLQELINTMKESKIMALDDNVGNSVEKLQDVINAQL